MGLFKMALVDAMKITRRAIVRRRSAGLCKVFNAKRSAMIHVAMLPRTGGEDELMQSKN